jgi:TRAP transporter TAXI family solute receptor
MKRKMMMKMALFLGVVSLAGLLCLPQSSECSEKKGPQEVRLAGGPAGGAKAMRMEGLAESIRRSNPEYRARVISGIHSTAAFDMVSKSELELDVVPPDTIMEVEKGLFHGYKLKAGPLPLRVLSPSHSARALMVVLEKVPVNSIAELKEKRFAIRVGVGPKNSDFEIRNRRVLEVYGIKYDDIKAWGGKYMYLGDTSTINLMRDGLADGFINFGTHPSGKIQELAATRKLKIFTVSDPAAMEKAKSFGYTTTVLPKATYDFMKGDMPTIQRMESVVCAAKMDNEVAYGITKGIWENRDYLHKVHPLYKVTLQPDVIAKWAREMKELGIDIHPGSLKYWKEKGLVR